MDNDFFWNTIEYSKCISNDEMQELIAKIIAGEYNTPGTYSMSTLQTIKMLGKHEIELFEKICFLCLSENDIPEEVFALPEEIKQILKPLNIDFASFLALQNLGLFYPNSMSATLINSKKETLEITYFDKTLSFKPIHSTDFDIILPNCYELSKTGKQILQHLKPTYNEEYYQWLKANYKIPNYTLIEN